MLPPPIAVGSLGRVKPSPKAGQYYFCPIPLGGKAECLASLGVAGRRGCPDLGDQGANKKSVLVDPQT